MTVKDICTYEDVGQRFIVRFQDPSEQIRLQGSSETSCAGIQSGTGSYVGCVLGEGRLKLILKDGLGNGDGDGAGEILGKRNGASGDGDLFSGKLFLD